MYSTDVIGENIDLRKITRITVVTKEGLVLEKWNAYEEGVILSVQDDGLTLKVFPGGTYA